MRTKDSGWRAFGIEPIYQRQNKEALDLNGKGSRIRKNSGGYRSVPEFLRIRLRRLVVIARSPNSCEFGYAVWWLSLGPRILANSATPFGEMLRSIMQQFFEVHLYRFGEGGQMVAAFETTDQPAVSMGAGHVENLMCQGGEVFGLQPERTNRVARVGIEAGTDEDQLGLDLVGGLFQGGGKALVVVRRGGAEGDRNVQREAQPPALAGFRGRAGAGVKAVAVAMNAEKQHFRVFIEDVLRTVAVVHIKVHDEDA